MGRENEHISAQKITIYVDGIIVLMILIWESHSRNARKRASWCTWYPVRRNSSNLKQNVVVCRVKSSLKFVSVFNLGF